MRHGSDDGCICLGLVRYPRVALKALSGFVSHISQVHALCNKHCFVSRVSLLPLRLLAVGHSFLHRWGHVVTPPILAHFSSRNTCDTSLSEFLHHPKSYRRVYAHRDRHESTLHTSAIVYLMSPHSSPEHSPTINPRRRSIAPRPATKGTTSDTIAIDYFHATDAGQPRHYTSLQEHSDRTQREDKVNIDNGASPRQESRREGFS